MIKLTSYNLAYFDFLLEYDISENLSFLKHFRDYFVTVRFQKIPFLQLNDYISSMVIWLWIDHFEDVNHTKKHFKT
jgi:hypothetical protein